MVKAKAKCPICDVRPINGNGHYCKACFDRMELEKRKVKIAPTKFLTYKLFPGPVKVSCRVTKAKDNSVTQTLQVESKDRLLITIGVSGNFPNYEPLIPAYRKNVKFQRKDMLEALKLMLMANPVLPNTRLITKGRNLSVFTFDNEAKTEMLIPATGKVKVALQGKQLSEILGHLPDGLITMRWDGAEHPVMFKIPGAVHVVMPMKSPETVPAKPITPASISYPATPTPSTEAAAAVAQAEEIVAEAAAPVTT